MQAPLTITFVFPIHYRWRGLKPHEHPYKIQALLPISNNETLYFETHMKLLTTRAVSDNAGESGHGVLRE